MKRRTQVVVCCLLAMGALVLTGAQGKRRFKRDVPFGKAQIKIELNSSADDIGVQVLLDGEPWERVSAFGPNGRKILDIQGRRSLAIQGLTELFFESSEPSLADVPLEEFFRRFPEGEYEFEGRTTQGDEIEGVATLTHAIPAGPVIVSPVGTEDEPPVVDPDDLVIEWEPVIETIDGSGDIEIVGYQLIVEQVDPPRTLSLDVPGDVTSVRVPPEFFAEPDALHKFEVLAVEAGGNQTITEGEFVTASDGP